MATIFLYHQKVKFVYSANLLLGKRVLLSALFLLCFIGLSGATSAFVGTPPAGNVAETQTSEPPKNSGGGKNWSAVFESPRPLVQDWRQYAARDEVKPELQTPGRIVLERTPLSHYPIQILLLTLQANNIQVREAWQVSNDIGAFDINNNGELYLMADDEVATLVATVYLIDNFQMLNTAYQNLTASAVITVEVMSGDLSAEQPKRLEVVAGMAEEVYVFDVHGGTRPHTYTLLHNPDTNAFAFSNGTLAVNVSATIGEYRFTVAVADAGNMSVTVVATVSVGAAATIQVAGGAVFVVQGQEQEVGDGDAISFNPRSQSGVMVSVKAAATVALTAPDDAWQITLYGGGEAFFAGVAEAGSDDVVVGVSLMGDSDFVRSTDEKVVLDYVFSDEVIVPVEPQGTRIFCRSYGGLWYLVIDEGVANLPRGRSNYVNFLAFGDGRWNLNDTLFKEEEPFTLDDFMATVSYRYVGEVGEVQANDGVAPSFSLVGDTEVFALTMWSGLRYDQWLPGLLAIIEGQAGPLTLSVTVSAEDHLGDMLGYGYANRMATVTAVVQVESVPPLVLSVSEARTGIVGYKDVLLSFTANGGALPYTYSIVASNDSGYFDITDSGELSVLEDAVAGIYTLSIVLRDSEHQSATVAITVTVTIQDIQEGASRIFVLGGYDNNNLSDVWSATDSEVWSLETATAGWSGREEHQALSHNGRLYVLGGGVSVYYENAILKNDVWSSTDGKTWMQETADADWSVRSSHQALSHNGRIYVLGGSRGEYGEYKNDVWSSADGKNWSLETIAADWSARSGHQALSHNGRLYVLGGLSAVGPLNDVWSSADGKNWSLETGIANWPIRDLHQALSHKGRIYVLGGVGNDEETLNDVWSSADGQTWMQETADADWSVRDSHEALSYNGRIYVLGGLYFYEDDFDLYSDVWSSVDGQTWTLETDDANWSRRSGHQAVVFPSELALLGVGERLTVSAGIAANLHTFTAQYGEGNYSYSLGGETDGFKVSPSGVLSADNTAVPGKYILTIWVEDGAGDLAQTAVKVIVPYFNLAEVPRLVGLAGVAKDLYTFTTDSGIAGEQYTMVAGNTPGYFALDADSGVLSLLTTAWEGVYTLSVEVSDSSSSSNKATAVATVEIRGKQIFVLGGNDGQDSSNDGQDTSNNLNDVWFSGDGANWVRETDDAGWSRRLVHQALSHNGQLYVLGGGDSNSLNDVWSSADGKNWVLETDDASWSRRFDHQALSHNGRLYVLGGDDDTNRYNDVWSSADGKNWVLETDDASWSRRYLHQALSHNGRLYVLGGSDDSHDSLNDVWSSADGKSWVLETAHAKWSRRFDHQALSHNGRLYVLGGNDDTNLYNDVWSSADGKNWVLETAAANWSRRSEHQSVSHNGRLYVLGGDDGSDKNDVWSSADGKSWEEETDGANWSKRWGHQAVVFPPPLALFGVGERLTVSAGIAANLHTFTAQYGRGGYSYSLGGEIDEFKVSPSGVLSAEDTAAMGEHILTIWVEDGAGNRAQTAVRVLVPYFNLAEVPRLVGLAGIAKVLHTFTTDGGIPGEQYMMVAGNTPGYFHLDADSGVLSLLTTAWEGVYTLSVEVSDSSSSSNKATAAATVEIRGKQIFVLGGYDGQDTSIDVQDPSNYLNDVWFSADGANWVRETDDAGWSRRFVHQALSHNGLLYVLGGYDSNSLNDVWSSADGQNWSRETNAAEWAGRFDHQALSHNGRLYVLGGDDDTNFYNDVWSSADGKNWVLETNDASWSRRALHQALSHNGRLYVLGGEDDSDRNDVWSSVDGKNWSMETANAGWSRRYEHQALSHNGRLYVLGGEDDTDNLYNDVWSSADGKSWALETGGAEWARRNEHQALSHNGRLYVLGGDDSSNNLNDVWSSADGKNWSLETDGANWSKRRVHQAVVFPPPLALFGVGERLTVSAGIEANLHTFTAQYGRGGYSYSLGGETDGFIVDPSGVLETDGNAATGEHILTIWVEDDAGDLAQTAVKVFVPYFNLVEVPHLAGFAGIAKDLHTFTTDGGIPGEQYTIVAGNKEYFHLDADSGILSLLTIALEGVYTLSVEVSDSSSSSSKATVTVTVTIQEVGDSRIFVLGGADDVYGTGLNDVWSATDNEAWSLETAAAGWSGREEHQALSHNGRLYVLGGGVSVYYENPILKNDVWSSTDGKTWMQETDDADWSVRSSHQALSHNGRLYVLGGARGENEFGNVGEYKNDVWSSADGKNWSREIIAADWSARSGHQALSHNGRIYVLGGFNGVVGKLNDVWSSADGKNWSLETGNANWPIRNLHQSLSHKGRIYVLGGISNNDETLNDVWSSADGQTWRLETDDADWSVRDGHEALSYNGQIYVLGGLYYEDDSDNEELYNDVWSSVDGRTWMLETNSANWSKRAALQAVVFPPEAE